MKKYELTSEFKMFLGRKLFRIRALIDFRDVKAGDLGGWIEKEENLDQDGDAWIYGNAKICDNARIYGNAKICGDAWIYGDAKICDNARIYGNAKICGDAEICGNKDYAGVFCFGSEFRTTTFFRTKDKLVKVKCGCFYGTIEEFRNKVKETHGDSKKAKEYLMTADLMELRFTEGKDV